MHAGYYKVLCHYSVYIDMHLLVFTRFLCSFEGLQVVHSLHVRDVCVHIIQTGAACVGICGLYLLLIFMYESDI